MNVFISEQAETDLLQTYRYLAERNPAAERVVIVRVLDGRRDIDAEFRR